MGASNAGENNANSILNGLTPQLQQLVSNYLTTYAPQLANLVQGQAAAQPGYAANTATAGSSLQNLGGQLENFQALTPANVSALTSQAGNAVNSAAQTFAAQSGGVPNAALQERNLATQAGQTAGDVATNLGNTAAQQRLGALEGAGTAFSGAGNIFGGLNQQSLQAILQGIGLGNSALQTGTQGLQGNAATYLQEQQMANASSPWSQISQLLGAGGSLAGLFMGGGAGAGAAALGGGGNQIGNPLTPGQLQPIPTVSDPIYNLGGATGSTPLNSQGGASSAPEYTPGP